VEVEGRGVRVTHDAVLSLLSREQTIALFESCLSYLEVDEIEAALRRGCTELERRQLAFQLSIEFDRL
jgi:hypothetical protein